MSEIRERFKNIRDKIIELVKENDSLRTQVSELKQSNSERYNDIQKLEKENNRLKEEKRLVQLSSNLGKDTAGLKNELQSIKREIEESLTLMREK